MEKKVMKKAIATSLSFAMLLGLSACGTAYNTEFELNERASREAEREKYSTEEISTTESNKRKKEIDPFENVSYSISESDGWFKNIYPSDFTIKFEAGDSPLGTVATYTYFIESANDKEIVIRSRANIDNEEVQKFMDENNYMVKDNETTFTIKVADLNTDLLSADSFDAKAKEQLKAQILDLLNSNFKMSEDEEFEYAPDALGLMQNNPDYIAERNKAKEEFEKKKEESLKLKFEVKKLYVLIPKDINYNLWTQKTESSISHHSDDTSFEDKEIYSNYASLEIKSSNASKNKTYAIISNNNGEFYAVNCGSFISQNGELTSDNLKLLFCSDGWDIDYTFDTEKDILDQYIDSSSSDFIINEIKFWFW